MGYAWCSRHRLAPMRMVPENGSYPKYEIVKMERPRLRAYRKRLRPARRLPRIQMLHMCAAGRLGQWPVFRYGKRARQQQREG